MRGYSLTRTPRHSLCRTPLRTGTPGEERGNKGSPTEANACCVSTPGRTLRLLVSLPLGDSQRQPSGLRWHTLCPVGDRPYFRWGGRNIPSESMALGSHQAKVETVAFWGEPCSVTVAQITWVLRLLAAQAAKCFKATAFQSGDAWSTLRAEGRVGGLGSCSPGKPQWQRQAQWPSGCAQARPSPPPTGPAPQQPTRCGGNHAQTHRTQALYSEHGKNSQAPTIRGNNSIKIWAKDVNRHFTKEGTRMAKKYI